MVPEGLKRASAVGLLGLSALLFVMGGDLRCPFWQAGLPCPSCGVTRAIIHLTHGNVLAAFSSNLLFPYWLVLGGGVTFGLLAYAAGLTDRPETIGRRTLEAVAPHVHAGAFLLSTIANFIQLGVNPDGWVWRFLPI